MLAWGCAVYDRFGVHINDALIVLLYGVTWSPPTFSYVNLSPVEFWQTITVLLGNTLQTLVGSHS